MPEVLVRIDSHGRERLTPLGRRFTLEMVLGKNIFFFSEAKNRRVCLLLTPLTIKCAMHLGFIWLPNGV